MDGDEHRAFRAVVDSYMTSDAVADAEPMLAEVAAKVVDALPRAETVDAVHDLGAVFAVRAQCRWLGWPAELESELLTWMDDHRDAVLRMDPARHVAVADAFDDIVRRQVDARRDVRAEDPDRTPRDVTERLLLETVHGRPLTTEEIVSILRNWTAGDLSSLALCVGVLVRRLADEAPLQDRLRFLFRAADAARNAEIDAIIDECLRIEDPFVSNRRVTTCPVALPDGQRIPADTTVILDWAEANRDPEVFGDPDAFDPIVNRPRNLIYGIGPHACPGRELATAELRAVLAALLTSTPAVRPADDERPTPEQPPLAGWARVPIVLG